MAVQEHQISRAADASESTCWGMGRSRKAASAGRAYLVFVHMDRVALQLDYVHCSV